MTELTLEQLNTTITQPESRNKFTSVVNYHGVQIEPWNHPRSIARYILNYVKHTKSFGCQFIAPMGHGKSTAASVIAHYIHMEDSNYLVVWAEANDFQHLKRFLLALPKQPMVIIFDDITSALKQMPDRDIEKNFEDLTKIRWIIDPAKGEIPTILIANYHYSKNLEKEFRAVLGMSIFLAFGSEEHTNIDTILPKHTKGRKTLEHFSTISDRMFTQGDFQLLHSNGQVITYKTDQPCRASCAVMGKEARIILMSKNDICPKCAKTSYKKYANPDEVLKIAMGVYGGYGKKALKMALYKRGFYEVFAAKLRPALEFIENKIFVEYDIRLDQLAESLIRYDKMRVNTYRKRKKENEGLEELQKTVEKVKLEKPEITPHINPELNNNDSEDFED